MRWDAYFLSICNAVGSNSKCMSRKIGAILVRDKVVICTGYNGPPRGIAHCEGEECPRRTAGYKSGEGLHLCPAAHAERNAIVQAARLGIQTKEATLYLNTGVPCKDCLIEMINAGISEIVCTNIFFYDNLSETILNQSHLKVREFEL